MLPLADRDHTELTSHLHTQASRAALDLQARLEEYEYFPIIKVAVEPDGNRVKVVLTNTSPRNGLSSYEIRFVLRISAGVRKFSVSEENFVYRGNFLAPNEVAHISPDEINQCVVHALPALSHYPPEQNHFVLRAIVECTPPHPKSEKFFVESVGYFVYEQGHLTLKNEKPAVGAAT